MSDSQETMVGLVVKTEGSGGFAWIVRKINEVEDYVRDFEANVYLRIQFDPDDPTAYAKAVVKAKAWSEDEEVEVANLTLIK